MAQTPEGKVKRKITAALKELGVWYFFPVANIYARGGIPDIIAIVNGLFVGIEVKANAKRKPTDLQIKTGEEIQQAGGYWKLVYDDESLQSLLRLINELLDR